MRFTLASTILAIGAATSAFAADIQVTLEPTAFSPTNVTASAGDVIVFTFPSSNHSVTQSSFDKPCEALDGGIDSGFEPVSDNTTLTFNLTINDTTPLFFFCRQTGHCAGDGQVFAVNLAANETFEEFQAAANASSSSSNSTTNSTSTSGTSTGSKKPSSTGTSPSSTSSSSSSSGAMRTGAGAGGLLAVFGFITSILL